MASSNSQGNKPTLKAAFKRNSRERPTNENAIEEIGSVHSSPSTLSPSSPSQSRFSIRRTVSAASPETGSPQSAVENGPQKRSSRISSFIRRYHSNPKLKDFTNRGIPHSLIPGTPPIPIERESYNAASLHPLLTQLDTQPFPYSTGQFIQWPLSSQPANTFSPIVPNQPDHQSPVPRPHTAIPTPIPPSLMSTNPLDKPLPELPLIAQPIRVFSSPAAPESSNPSHRVIDSSRAMESEPEGFSSPTEFALFAEATSSFSFLPSTFEAGQTRSSTPQSQSQTLPARHLIPLPHINTNTNRSRSVPAASGPSHHRSVSATAVIPIPNRRPSPPRPLLQELPHSLPSTQSDLQPTSQAPSIPSQPRSRSQLIAEALLNMDDVENNGRGADDELPDYATSQAEASARQRTEAARRARELEESWRRGRMERSRKPWRA
jgi:hypothetical protein